MKEGRISLIELSQQIKKVEGVNIDLSVTSFIVPFDASEPLFMQYLFSEPMGNDKTVDDLRNRIQPIIEEGLNHKPEGILQDGIDVPK